MVEEYPAIVETFKVVGRLVLGVGDSDDEGQAPEIKPIPGAVVTFTPTLAPPVYKIPGATPPMTVHQEIIHATTDEDGYLVTKDDPTKRGVVLVWGGSPAILPTGWTWNISVTVPGGFPAKSFPVFGAPDAILDLTTLIPVPANPGADVAEWIKVSNEVKMAVDEYIVSVDGWGDAYGDVTFTQLQTRSKYLKRRLLGDLKLTLEPGLPGKAYSTSLRLQQDDIGSRKITFVNVQTVEKLDIPLTTTPYAIDLIRLEWDGDSWSAFRAGTNFGVPAPIQ